MFTGLVADVGKVTRLERASSGALLEIATPLAAELSVGDSIAVNGVCLTATSAALDRFTADAIAQTLRASALGELTEGDAVNLELPLRLSDRLGGHIVQGHVDGVAALAESAADGSSLVLTFELPRELARHVVEKGSVALDGVSLTVSAIDGTMLTVSLIPETSKATTLGRLRPGDRVNVEVDVLAKHVARLVEGGCGGLAAAPEGTPGPAGAAASMSIPSPAAAAPISAPGPAGAAAPGGAPR